MNLNVEAPRKKHRECVNCNPYPFTYMWTVSSPSETYYWFFWARPTKKQLRRVQRTYRRILAVEDCIA